MKLSHPSLMTLAAFGLVLSASCSDSRTYPLCVGDCGASGTPPVGGSSGAPGGGSGGTAGTPNGGLAGTGGSAPNQAGSHSGGSAGDSGEPDGGGAGAPGGQAGGGGEGPSDDCDTTSTPALEPCLVSDEHAVFVLADEDSMDGAGTLADPLGRLDLAIARAREDGKIVIACLDNYVRPLEITGAPGDAPVRVFGGFICTNEPPGSVWVHSEQPSTLRSEEGPALVVRDAANVELENFRFIAADAGEPGESSIAAVVASSSEVVFRRVTFEAGEGMDGAPGAESPARLPAAPAGHDGTPTEGAEPQLACTCSESVGGGGGDPGSGAVRDGETGQPDPGSGEGLGGKGGSSCAGGGAGANGSTGSPGTAPTGHGSIEGLSWIPGGGEPGGDGGVGQGGGGASASTSGGGGGGGCGGCGGKGGAPGQGGGASIGLLVIDAEVTLIDVQASTANAGDGGNGSPGQPGQPQGPGGDGEGCDGGPGGVGGDGGPGGGGAGGISVGVVYRGEAPAGLDRLTVDQPAGSAGTAGTGAGEAPDGIQAPSLAL